MVRPIRGDEKITNLSAPELFKIPNEYYENGDITATATLGHRHLGRVLMANSGSAIVLTVPADSATRVFIDGETFTALQYGAGQLSFVGAVGVTILTPSGLNALARYAIIGVIRTQVANEWVAFGNLTT